MIIFGKFSQKDFDNLNLQIYIDEYDAEIVSIIESVPPGPPVMAVAPTRAIATQPVVPLMNTKTREQQILELAQEIREEMISDNDSYVLKTPNNIFQLKNFVKDLHIIEVNAHLRNI